MNKGPEASVSQHEAQHGCSEGKWEAIDQTGAEGSSRRTLFGLHASVTGSHPGGMRFLN